MTPWSLVVLVLASACTPPADAERTSQVIDPSYSSGFAYLVGHASGMITDAARARDLEYDVAYPIGTPVDELLPVVIWSHGGITRTGDHDGY